MSIPKNGHDRRMSMDGNVPIRLRDPIQRSNILMEWVLTYQTTGEYYSGTERRLFMMQIRYNNFVM